MLNLGKALLHKQSLQTRERIKIALLTLATASLGTFLQSCQKEELVRVEHTSTLSNEAIETNALQTAFAKILVRAIKADPELRNFLKQEAIKQFNGDDDILYQMVKDKSINGGKSLHTRLAQYADATQLTEIEQKLPLLTVFVPTLPGGFTAATWDAQTDAPMIAVCLRGSNSVPYYDEMGVEHIVPDGSIPNFPILVIKQNERVTTKQVLSRQEESLQFYQNDKFNFYFIDSNFDFVHSKAIATRLAQNKLKEEYKKGVTNRLAEPSSLDSKVINAYQSNGADPNIAWQRDYVYYGISPNNSTGPLDYNYREVMRTIKFSVAALYQMSDQSEGNLKDPRLYDYAIANNPNWWTDGNFELQVSVLINANNGIGPSFNPVIPVNPRSLYDISYSFAGFFYKVEQVIPKEYSIELPILPWDLKSYGTHWKFSLVERDNTGTQKTSVQNSSSFGTNFNFEPQFGVFKKVGAKFGITASTSTDVSHEVTLNVGDDNLSEAVLSFERPIITGITNTLGTKYTTYEINNGPNSYFSASIEPARY